MTHYDVIVVGVGAMGALSCLELARRGARVLGIERHTVGHSWGSSHGETRLYRRAYFEAPGYVPLMDRALTLWRELQTSSGQELVVQTGLVLAGHAGSTVVAGAAQAAREHGLRFERCRPTELPSRFPGLRVPASWDVLFEPDAGFLRVDDCVRVAAAHAVERGARLLQETRVVTLHSEERGVRVDTLTGQHTQSFFAEKLVLTAGPWTAPFLGELGRCLSVRRKVTLWVETAPGAYALRDGTPAFGLHTEKGFFYGFPALEPAVIKVAEHTGGETVSDPDHVARDLREDDVSPLAAVIAAHLPEASARVVRHRVCLYTMTPDEHFILDVHPDHSNVVVGAGFSGHGFKFASVVGRALAELALDGVASEPVEFLRAARLGR